MVLDVAFYIVGHLKNENCRSDDRSFVDGIIFCCGFKNLMFNLRAVMI